jgi:hypothetical protein
MWGRPAPDSGRQNSEEGKVWMPICMAIWTRKPRGTERYRNGVTVWLLVRVHGDNHRDKGRVMPTKVLAPYPLRCHGRQTSQLPSGAVLTPLVLRDDRHCGLGGRLPRKGSPGTKLVSTTALQHRATPLTGGTAPACRSRSSGGTQGSPRWTGMPGKWHE